MTERETVWKHPVLVQFLQQHEDCSPVTVHYAFQVYLNLAEVRGWRDVGFHYCRELKTPFVTGRSSISAALEAAYPVAMEDSLSHQQIQTLFTALRVGQHQFDRIMLAMCATDGSVVYYHVSNSIVEPEPPENSDMRKQQWQKKAASRKRHLAESIDSFSQSQEDEPS
ncbi:tRNA-splicing endonuclease subunit Sen15-like [Babylonia areolata]|uniref:tRNA-splicing endonuclease subunit Sen15-like n=1 Tax=Babylonia areolata TaxID=304850 RepID=UPI003FD2184F